MRKEMDELRSVIKEKTDRSIDRMVRATDSPFTTAVLECPVPSKFRLPQLEPFDGLRDPQRSYKRMVHEVADLVHRQLRTTEQCLLAPFHKGAAFKEASRLLTYH